jgi:hypothetical protein
VSDSSASSEPTPPDQLSDAPPPGTSVLFAAAESGAAESAAAAESDAPAEPAAGAEPAAAAEPAATAESDAADSSAAEPAAGPDLAPAGDPAWTVQPGVTADVPPSAEPAPASELADSPDDAASAADSASPGWAVSFGFNLGKIPGQGEDSDPILHNGRDDVGLVAVFDGMGGAGGTVYQTPDGPRTGAYLAARVARDVVERRMRELLAPGGHLDGPAAAEGLHRAVEEALLARLAELHAPRSALRSKLLRALPTTMAMAAVQRPEPDGRPWTCHLMWAGDSRIYALDPTGGAHQLTLDDIRDGGDAMANLREDSVVSNAMSADTPFDVHHREVQLTPPFLLIAATDGCFGYFPSPMHFERLMLATLQDASDVSAWSTAVQTQITAITGDDASMAVLGAGADLDGFRNLFADRLSTLQQQWVGPLDELTAEIDDLEAQLSLLRDRQRQQTAELWAAYKPDYLRCLGEPSTEEEPS